MSTESESGGLPGLRVESAGRTLRLIIDNPAQRNALHPDMYRVGRDALRGVNPADFGAVVLVGSGGHFCSGGNLNRLRDNRRRGRDAQHASVAALHEWIVAIADAPVPVIAAVEGYAAGAGFSLALACDLLVASREAHFTLSYVKAGLSPDGGASAWLAHALPRQLASEMILDARPLGAERLHAAGVVNRLCEPGEALTTASGWASRLADGPSAALADCKRLLRGAYQPAGATLSAQLAAEQDALVDNVFGDDCAEGIAAFLEKRPARFQR